LIGLVVTSFVKVFCLERLLAAFAMVALFACLALSVFDRRSMTKHTFISIIHHTFEYTLARFNQLHRLCPPKNKKDGHLPILICYISYFSLSLYY
jgi:hypothetical protein